MWYIWPHMDITVVYITSLSSSDSSLLRLSEGPQGRGNRQFRPGWPFRCGSQHFRHCQDSQRFDIAWPANALLYTFLSAFNAAFHDGLVEAVMRRDVAKPCHLPRLNWSVERFLSVPETFKLIPYIWFVLPLEDAKELYEAFLFFTSNKSIHVSYTWKRVDKPVNCRAWYWPEVDVALWRVRIFELQLPIWQVCFQIFEAGTFPQRIAIQGDSVTGIL